MHDGRFRVNRGGSPAHAGIDPPATGPYTAYAGFPRTRGDRPRPPVAWMLRKEVPPHTRG